MNDKLQELMNRVQSIRLMLPDIPNKAFIMIPVFDYKTDIVGEKIHHNIICEYSSCWKEDIDPKKFSAFQTLKGEFWLADYDLDNLCVKLSKQIDRLERFINEWKSDYNI